MRAGQWQAGRLAGSVALPASRPLAPCPCCLQVRAARLSEQPLTSVALVPAIGSGCSGGAQHPIALCGSFDACVHAYSADYGRQLGSFQAASDAVACVQVVGGSGASCRLLTASWDGSVKLWDLQEGRQPWDASFSQPTAHVAAPSGVWAMAASPDGHLVLAGAHGGGRLRGGNRCCCHCACTATATSAHASLHNTH